MGNAKLKSGEYIAVRDGAALSFGGNQRWLAEGRPEALAKCSCGAVAAADLFLYLARSRPQWESPLCAAFARAEELSKEEYLRYLSEVLARYARPLPYFGKTGFGLAQGINRYFAENRLGLKAKWRQTALDGGALMRIAAQLADDLPVILSIPSFPLKIKSLNMYRRSREGRGLTDALRYKNRSGHFVTACALEDRVLTVSSWGKRFYLDCEEYLRAARLPAGLISCGYMTLEERASRTALIGEGL
ncbi:MAG: hypothetical protein Q4B42_00075 [Oscillospiraceae bacterium]|nr:hypothetical protein [Oscillospiraceae bacterium]